MNKQLTLQSFLLNNNKKNEVIQKINNQEIHQECMQNQNNDKLELEEDKFNNKLELEENNNKQVINIDKQNITKEFDMFKEQLLTWEKPLQKYLQQKQFKNIYDYLLKEYNSKTIYPKFDKIFNAFQLTSFQNLKVVIVGQDPYINENQAMGLSFSVPRSQKQIPPSLINIFKGIEQDKGISNAKVGGHGDLTKWAQQGILLLNGILTVEKGKSNSHKSIGWSEFTDHVIQVINQQCDSIVFILWGNPAQQKAKNVDTKKHFILKACHPSPLSAYKGNFFDCKHFSQTNNYLISVNKSPIDWSLD